MIDAAERLVAERGMPAMTLKDVQIAADQSNKSAAKYHFGSRDGLIEAVVEARMSPVDRCRQEILDEWARQGLSPTPRQAVEALVQPLAAQTLGRPGSRYARFLVQATFDPALADIIQKHMSAKSFRHVHDLLVNLAEVPGRSRPGGRPTRSPSPWSLSRCGRARIARRDRRPRSSRISSTSAWPC